MGRRRPLTTQVLGIFSQPARKEADPMAWTQAAANTTDKSILEFSAPLLVPRNLLVGLLRSTARMTSSAKVHLHTTSTMRISGSGPLNLWALLQLFLWFQILLPCQVQRFHLLEAAVASASLDQMALRCFTDIRFQQANCASISWPKRTRLSRGILILPAEALLFARCLRRSRHLMPSMNATETRRVTQAQAST